MKTIDMLTALLRAGLTGAPLADGVAAAAAEKADEIYKIAKFHDVAHIFAAVIKRCGVAEKGDVVLDAFAEAEELAYFRYKLLSESVSEICRALDEKEIPYILLKGARVRAYYPEPWMRTSGDVDILVREGDIDAATAHLASALSYKVSGKREFHDVSLFSPRGVHLELHFSVLENMESPDAVLRRVWDYASAVEGARYELSDEFFVFHTLAHAAYHLVNGGCGIKPFMDLYLLRGELRYDEEKLRALLSEAGLLRFYEGALELVGAWFLGGEHTELSRKIEAQAVFNAFTRGQSSSQVVATASKGKAGYIISRILPPLKSMKIRYPVLKKCPILLPFTWVARWFSFLFCGDKSRAASEIGANITDEQQAGFMAFLGELGLK